MEHDSKTIRKLKKIGEGFGIGNLRRHIFLCLGPDCCKQKEGELAWKHLKDRLKQLDPDFKIGIFRTKAGCLRVCCQGPIAVVYPEGTWYHSMNPEHLERVIQEHLLNGKVVEEFAFAVNPLS